MKRLYYYINRHGRGLFLLLAVLAALLLSAGNALAAEEAGPGAQSVEASLMEVSWGFENTARRGRYLPVHVALRGEEYPEALPEEGIAASLIFMVQESGGEICRYEYPVTMNASRTAGDYYIPLGVRSDELKVLLLGGDGEILAEKRIVLPEEQDLPRSLVGIFTEDRERTSWIDNTGLEEHAFVTRAFWLDEESAPENPLAYDILDMLVISDYRLSRLSPEQIRAIEDFAGNGGILLFGGGERFEEAFGPLADKLLLSPRQTAREIMVNMGPEYADQNPEDAMRLLKCADIPLIGGSVLLSGENFPLLSAASWQSGRVAAAAFSLGDISSFCEEHPVFARRFLTQVYGTEKLDELSYGGGGISDTYYSVMNLIGAGSTGRLPNNALYFLVLVAYLLLIGPGIYIFLQNRSRNRFYLALVTICSILFTGLIYVMGVRTRFTGPFYHYATILDVSDTAAREETYVNVRSPYNRPYSTRLETDYIVSPVTDPYATRVTAQLDDPSDYNIGISYEEAFTDVRIRGMSAFTPTLFRLTRAADQGGTPQIGGQVTVFEDRVSGIVRNTGDRMLTAAAILLYGKIIPIGTLPPGAELSLGEMPLVNCPVGDPGQAADYLTGILTGPDEKELAGEERRVAIERSRLLEFYMDHSPWVRAGGAELVAFTEGGRGGEFLDKEFRVLGPDGTPVRMSGHTIVTARIPLSRTEGGRVYRCALQDELHVVAGNYDPVFNLMYTYDSAEILELEYSLGSRMEIEKVLFEMPDEAFARDAGSEARPFRGSMRFYNYDTGKYDLMTSGSVYERAELAPYLSPSNTITVQYVGGENGEDTSFYLPVVYSVGREDI